MNPLPPVGTSGTNAQESGDGLNLVRSVLLGGFGFALVSVAGFAVWAFAGRWLHAKIGEVGLFAACLVTFLGSSGLLLHRLVRGPLPFWRFYRIFVPAFVAYAVLWCAAWFALRFGIGEWVGSVLGSIAFVAVTAWGIGNHQGFLKASTVLFIFHSAGYFLGGRLMLWIGGAGGATVLSGFSHAQIAATAKLAWGLLYGLGFGAGIGQVFYSFQRPGTSASCNIT